MSLQLVGMLDSPYVRRVAVALQLLELPYQHRPLSVFRDAEAMSRINPVTKVPALVCEDGQVLLDSTLIIAYLEERAGRELLPTEAAARLRERRLVGLALVACEKAVQWVYERDLRPPERLHAPWLERVQGQLAAAWRSLEQALAEAPLPHGAAADVGQAALSLAVAWRFTRQLLPGALDPAMYPRTQALADALEAMPAFRAVPHD